MGKSCFFLFHTISESVSEQSGIDVSDHEFGSNLGHMDFEEIEEGLDRLKIWISRDQSFLSLLQE